MYAWWDISICNINFQGVAKVRGRISVVCHGTTEVEWVPPSDRDPTRHEDSANTCKHINDILGFNFPLGCLLDPSPKKWLKWEFRGKVRGCPFNCPDLSDSVRISGREWQILKLSFNLVKTLPWSWPTCHTLQNHIWVCPLQDITLPRYPKSAKSAYLGALLQLHASSSERSE